MYVDRVTCHSVCWMDLPKLGLIIVYTTGTQYNLFIVVCGLVPDPDGLLWSERVRGVKGYTLGNYLPESP